MRLKTYIETQELTEGTFLFEQQVHRELQECTYEDWCNILDNDCTYRKERTVLG